MRRFLTLVCVLFVALPAGITISGCTRNPAANYCNGLGYGPKLTEVAKITLDPQFTGISLAFGQTRQIGVPVAANCKGDNVSIGNYAYGTTNNQLIDVSPSGNMCAGTWNRNSGGGIGDYTICTAPSPLPNTGGLPYATAYVSATAQSVTSNPVEVFVHTQVSSISLVGPKQCLSQNQTAFLDAQACFSANYGSGQQQYELCAPSSVASADYACPLPPNVRSVPACTSSIGTLSFAVGASSIASINQENNQITALLPGTTAIIATTPGIGSSAGYFSTCPPASISVALNGSTSATVTKGVTQNLVTHVVDTAGQVITGLTLDYQSTNPVNVSATGSGSVTASFPGSGTVYAVCQPPNCNPSPINQVGIYGTGLPIASNPVNITVPGTASSYVWYSAPGQSQYFVPVELLTGAVGSPVRLPYVPNSMVMDRDGSSIYFGSDHELMTVSPLTNVISSQNTGTPGVVLAVAPNSSFVLVNDQTRKVFYVVGTGNSGGATFGGLGVAAQWTPDSKTLYIVDTAAAGNGHSNTLYVYNSNTGWTTCAAGDPTCAGHFAGAASLAVTVPGVGAYLSGNPTVARTWCPSGTAASSLEQFYPEGDSVNVATDVLAATADGQHILGAAAAGGKIAFSDIAVTIPPSQACPQSGASLTPLNIQHTLLPTATLNVSATAVNQIVTSPAAVANGTSGAANSLTFITYSGSTATATLPYYQQTVSPTSSFGTLGYVTFGGSAASSITAPVAGAFSPDNTTFFVSTSGDNQVHYIDTKSLKDTLQISPNLPACTPVAPYGNGTDPGCKLTAPSSTPVPATAIAVKPRTTT